MTLKLLSVPLQVVFNAVKAINTGFQPRDFFSFTETDIMHHWWCNLILILLFKLLDQAIFHRIMIALVTGPEEGHGRGSKPKMAKGTPNTGHERQGEQTGDPTKDGEQKVKNKSRKQTKVKQT